MKTTELKVEESDLFHLPERKNGVHCCWYRCPERILTIYQTSLNRVSFVSVLLAAAAVDRSVTGVARSEKKRVRGIDAIVQE
jgi:hypothetical protein